MFLLLLAAQAAPAAPAAAPTPPPQRFSILQPVGNAPCVPRADAPTGQPGDVVVCADALPDQTVPLPQEYVYNSPRPSNPELTGTGALRSEGNPCATLQGGCQVGFGQPIIQALMKGAVDLIGQATRKRYPKAGRVPIPLDGPLPGRPATAPPPADLNAGATPAAASTSARPSGSANP